jgi:uncharacterized protein (DUF1330 family)
MSAYVLIRNRVVDDDAMQAYIPQAVGAILANGGEILVVEEDAHTIEGEPDFPRTVIIKFESREQALAFYESPEYQAILPIRLGATEGHGVIVDGFVMPG